MTSLYGEDSGHHLFPARTHIAALDVLILDLQDVGARYYTYYASMANCMEVAAARMRRRSRWRRSVTSIRATR